MFLDKAVYYSDDETSLFLRGGLSCPMLWPDQELETVVKGDCSTLESLWYTCGRVAQAIFDLFSQTQSGRMKPIPWFDIEAHEEIFLPPCPLCGTYEDVRIPRTLEIVAVPQSHAGEIYAHVLESRERFIVGDARKFAVDRWALIFSKLHPHLIGKHSFFQGQWPYRLDPERLITFLKSAQLL